MGDDMPTDGGAPQVQRLFVDEAGDPTLFNELGAPIVGTVGCSRYFMIGKLEVDDPVRLAKEFMALREELVADPYFAGVPSFRPEKRKTAVLFHAKDDVPEVRYRVFSLLRRMGEALRFHAVVCDKDALLCREVARRESEPGYRYQPDSIYDGLFRSLFGKFHRLADHYEICVAKRGNRARHHAIETAVTHADRDFEERFGFARHMHGACQVIISDPQTTACLQAVDYFLWAVQRFYEVRPHQRTGEEIREDRFLNLLWRQIGEIHDLDYGPERGTFFTTQKPLTIEERFGGQKRKKKMP